MIYPSADKLEEQVGSRYTLVILAAKRAKQLREGASKLIETESTNPLTIALEEIAAGKVISQVPSHDEIPARGYEPELEVLPGMESAEEEAAELVAAPVDEAARVAELLKLPGTTEGEEEAARDEQPAEPEATAEPEAQAEIEEVEPQVEPEAESQPEIEAAAEPEQEAEAAAQEEIKPAADQESAAPEEVKKPARKKAAKSKSAKEK